MKLKNFQELIEQRFNKKEITDIEQQAELAVKALRALQKNSGQAAQEPSLVFKKK